MWVGREGAGSSIHTSRTPNRITRRRRRRYMTDRTANEKKKEMVNKGTKNHDEKEKEEEEKEQQGAGNRLYRDHSFFCIVPIVSSNRTAHFRFLPLCVFHFHSRLRACSTFTSFRISCIPFTISTTSTPPISSGIFLIYLLAADSFKNVLPSLHSTVFSLTRSPCLPPPLPSPLFTRKGRFHF